MAYVDSINVRQGLAQNKSVTVLDDGAVAIRLKYIGTGTVTSVTMTKATNIVLVTSDGLTDTYTFATYSNMGLLADAINADGIFEAKILDALRTDETVNSDFLSNTAITVSADGYYNLYTDTSVALASNNDHIYTYRCAYDRGVNTGLLNTGHRVRLSEVLYNLDINAASAGGFAIYEWDAAAKTETLVYTRASVDITNTTINFAAGNSTLDAGFGNDLIVRVKNATSITNADANFLNVSYTRE